MDILFTRKSKGKMEFTKVQIGLLNGKENWQVWKYKALLLLRNVPNALEVIEGKFQKPQNLSSNDGSSDEEVTKLKSDLDVFMKADSLALIILTTNMSEETLHKVMRFTSSRDVWLELHRLFEGTSEDKAYDHCLEFFSYQRDPCSDISSHLSKLKNLWNNLKLEISKDQQNNFELPELFLICKILGTLPESYFSFRSSWMLLSKSDRTIDNLTIQLCCYEKALDRNIQSSTSHEALVVKYDGRSNRSNENRLQATHFRNKSVKQDSSKVVQCYYCKQLGHKVKQCSKWKADGRPPKPLSTVEALPSKQKDKNSSSNMTLMSIGVMNTEIERDCWYVDNGATNHVTFRHDLFQSFEPFIDQRTVTTANGESINAIGKGSIEVEAVVKGKWEKITLANVWYVPSIKKNLFSTLASQDLHFKSEFVSTTETCYLKVENKIVVIGSRCRNGGLYKLALRNVKPFKPVEVNLLSQNNNLLQLYHERMGHQNKRHVKALVQRELGVELKLDSELCEGCVYGKSHRLKFGTRERATQPGQLIHTDVCGPFQYSMSGYRYYVMFKDDFSRFRQIYFIKHKSEVSEKLKEMLAAAKTAGHVVKEILSDNGGEFDNGSVKNILKEHGIKHRLTMPYTPEQNGCCERENRTVVETARAMMHCHESLPQGLWAELINTAGYILNRTGPSSVAEKSPYELWFHKKPSVKHLRVIGSICYAHIPKQKRRKMDKKACKGVLVGYDDDGYRIWCRENNALIKSRDVVFREEPLLQNGELEIPLRSDEITKNDSRNDDNVVKESQRIISENENNEDCEDQNEEKDPGGQTRYDLRKQSDIKIPKKFEDYIMSTIEDMQITKEPETYTEAMNSGECANWKQAMDSEIKSHKENQTWNLEKLPNGKKCISCKWIYKVKTNPDGSVDRYKARLVVRGFSQKKGEDYHETFSPVARLSTIRAVLSVAATEKMSLTQFDVSTAFLNGTVEETIYMKQPEGYEDGSNRVCRLNKSLYGLKQAPRCWNDRFVKFMIQQGFKKSDADPCLFIKNKNNKKVLVALYVDDGLVASNDPQLKQEFMNSLANEFKITSKPATYFLGLEINKNEDGSLKISQPAYTRRLLKRFKMSDCKPVSTPIIKGGKTQESGKAVSREDSTKVFPYREVVGALMYLMTGTRPDIAFAVGKVSRTLENPTHLDIIRVKRILRYLKGTIEVGIEYKVSEAQNVLECYSDADHAGDEKTGRSTTGVVCIFGGGVITWLSQKQTSVAISSTEAEVVAASEACREIVWLKRLLKEMTSLKTEPVLYIDNEAATRLAQNPENHRRTKHVQTRHFFIRELVSAKEIEVKHIPAEFQVADCMTKPLFKPSLTPLLQAMGINTD